MGQGKKLQRRLLLHEEVSQYIKETILTGELKPGDRIVESRLAQELGVSQAPVREALRELEFSGLVEQKPFSGTYVKQVTVKEIRQFYEVRAALERLGAECAAQRMNKEQYQELAMTMFSMEEAARDHDLSEYIKCDARFHDQIVAAANNDLLSRLWEQCNIRSWLHVGTSLTGRDLPELASRHRRIFEALRSKDLEQLRAAAFRRGDALAAACFLSPGGAVFSAAGFCSRGHFVMDSAGRESAEPTDRNSRRRRR